MTRRKILGIMFGGYCGLMLLLLFFREPPDSALPYGERVLGLLNPVPFETICRFIRLLGHSNPRYVWTAVVNLVGNVVMFVPLGMFIPAVFPKTRRWWKVFLFSMAAVVLAELTQMLTLLGTCDIDDLFLNLLGAMTGYRLFRLGTKK